ncbi:MAG: hypothetical protein FWC58_08290 [Desulfobulbus sp.]|nr:hypothetical protein [Desulfobulbus sp.]
MSGAVPMIEPRMFCGGRAQFERVAAKYAENIFGGIVYGAVKPLHDVAFPLAWVELSVLGGETWYEVWLSPQPVTVRRDGRIVIASDGRLLFGSLNLPESAGLEAMAHDAYAEIFDALDRSAYPELLRAWNYFARINEDGEKLERYREFNVGRHAAFSEKNRAIGEGCVPAACALGARQGNLELAFLAGKSPGAPIENPRQTNAYRYPADFGPRSPTFSRGILVGNALLVSGTASIVGSATLHHDDVLMQLEETLENVRLVMKGARESGFAAGDAHGLFLNVYLRHAEDHPAVSRRLSAKFGETAHIVYLQADICRADLLVEIEAFWMPEVS